MTNSELEVSLQLETMITQTVCCLLKSKGLFGIEGIFKVSIVSRMHYANVFLAVSFALTIGPDN